MEVQKFTFNFFGENTYVVYDDTKECVIIDPGCCNEEELDVLKGFIAKNGLKPVKLLNTHCHIDHIFGNAPIASAYGIGLYCNALEVEWLQQAPYYGKAMYNVQVEPSPAPQGFLEEGDVVLFGTTCLEVFFAPGHSVGSLIFYDREGGKAIVGDVIFNGSIGRTDLPGGNFSVLEKSIKTKVYSMPDDTILYCGHMEETTVGQEKRFNPFVKG